MTTRTTFDPSKLGNPTLIHQRKERSLRKQAALLDFSLQPAREVLFFKSG